MGEQTLRGLATWLASMDESGSEARRTVTLDQIVTEAKDALENEGRSLFTQHEHELRQQVEGLLAAVEAVRSAPSEVASWQPEADLYKLADQVRKGLGEG